MKTSATTIELLVHVCTHFERFGDRIVPRSLVAPDPKAIAAAVMHPTQHISSPQAGLTFANAEEYRSYIAQRFLPGEKQTEPTPPKARRKPVQEEEDLVG